MVHSGKSAQRGSRDQDGGGGVCGVMVSRRKSRDGINGALTPATVPGHHTSHPAMLHAQ